MRVLMYAAAAIALVCTMWFAVRMFMMWKGIPYDSRSYCGDGHLVDTGPASFPRYRIILPAMYVTASKSQKFLIQGAPPISATLMLDIKFPIGNRMNARVEDDINQIKELPLIIRCRLTDEHGNSICSRSASVTEWEVAASMNQLGLWHPSLRDIILKRGGAYELVVDISSVADVPVDLVVTPMLQGGGAETP